MSDEETEVIKSGFATKCGGSVKSWKKRWFVLKSNGFLYYYDAADCRHEKGKIDVINANRASLWQEVTTADKLPSSVPASNSFAIVSIGRTYTCACDSSEDAKDWVEALNRVRGQKNQSSHHKSDQSAQPRPQTQYGMQSQRPIGFEALSPSRPQSMPPQYGLAMPQPSSYASQQQGYNRQPQASYYPQAGRPY